MLSSDHWGETGYEFRLSHARRSVASILGEKIDTPHGVVTWRVDGENPLGTQLAYLRLFEQWLERPGDKEEIRRNEIDSTCDRDDFQRPFPFRHTQLWADSENLELERYREVFKRATKGIFQADVAGIRNGLDHQRDPSRFPTEEQLVQCIDRLKAGVRSAEQNRVYPVTFWLESIVEMIFGSTEYVFRNNRGDRFPIHRPSTVSALPGITRVNPVVFAPVNFLGAADSVLVFKVMGESAFANYWANYPPISKTVPESRNDLTSEPMSQCEGRATNQSSEGVSADSVEVPASR